MRHALRLECIDYFRARSEHAIAKSLGDRHVNTQPWVARLLGRAMFGGLEREFVPGALDFSRANSVGSRGVYRTYALEPGVYEVFARPTWQRTRRYFLLVDFQGEASEITADEVHELLETEP